MHEFAGFEFPESNDIASRVRCGDYAAWFMDRDAQCLFEHLCADWVVGNAKFICGAVIEANVARRILLLQAVAGVLILQQSHRC